MGLINSDVVLATVQSYRLVWISGRFGGGKTSLAYVLARRFLESGYRLVTNNQSVWGDQLEDVQLLESGMLKAVVILDEGGLWFKSSKQIEMIASYAAKMDVIYLIPSFFPPTRTAQILVIQPVFNLKSAGLPLIVYRWRVRIGSFQDGGWFFWWRPSEIYGVYSRQDPGDTGSVIVEFLITRTEEFRARYGRALNSIPEMEITAEDRFSDAVDGMAEAADRLAAIPVRKTGRRRF